MFSSVKINLLLIGMQKLGMHEQKIQLHHYPRKLESQLRTN
jgi:hypothetical protein